MEEFDMSEVLEHVLLAVNGTLMRGLELEKIC